MGTTKRPIDTTMGYLRPRLPPTIPQRKFSYPAVLPTLSEVQAIAGRRRFSNVSEAVSRNLSRIAWRRPPAEVVAVGRALCMLYVRCRLKRANLFNKKLGLIRAQSAVGAVPGNGGCTVRDVFPALACACMELERLHPKLYANIVRQTGVSDETGLGGLLGAIGYQLMRIEPSWGKVVSIFCVAGGLAVDSVRQGHPELIHDLLDGMSEFLEDRLALWVAANGGWTSLSSRCRPRDQDISLVEYLGIFSLVTLILIIAYIFVRFFIKFSRI